MEFDYIGWFRKNSGWLVSEIRDSLVIVTHSLLDSSTWQHIDGLSQDVRGGFWFELALSVVFSRERLVVIDGIPSYWMGGFYERNGRLPEVGDKLLVESYGGINNYVWGGKEYSEGWFRTVWK